MGQANVVGPTWIEVRFSSCQYNVISKLIYYFNIYSFSFIVVSALTLLVGCQEWGAEVSRT